MNKKSVVRSGLLTFLFLFTTLGMACEIDLKVSDQFKKESYRIGDELVVEVSVILNHRNCHVDITKTKFKAIGAKIVGATKWEKKQPNTYSRKLKIEVTNDNKNDIEIICQRVCEKEGGVAKITLKKG
ncbi:hypothetical protein OM074_04690 [Marinilabiliaceae bacterium D04]|uniref:Uncharacterized protein n=2 Tax=Plebeiibacterium marinum TaxID=2992111 RepID=A0AAE3MCA5_9BACT|nr:hypothetical protein [Plebeiobacterium marinum]